MANPVRRQPSPPDRALLELREQLSAEPSAAVASLRGALTAAYGPLFASPWVVRGAVVDLCSPLMGIAVVVEGDHPSAGDDEGLDGVQELAELGIIVLRFTRVQVEERLLEVMERIHSVVLDRLDHPVSRKMREKHAWRLTRWVRRRLKAELSEAPSIRAGGL